ncbi:MAG TPA: nuclear transport factor 2 family protein [Oculatellaceae cyanobacterium]
MRSIWSKVLGISLSLLMLVFCSSKTVCAAPDKSDDVAKIKQVLDDQAKDWNDGSVDRFVQGYWQSNETVFVGANGVSRGFNKVLERYKRDYPDKKAMGHLSFSNLEVHPTCTDSAYALGEFTLERESATDGKKEIKSGYFTLYFRKFSDKWLIVADHTTAKAN